MNERGLPRRGAIGCYLSHVSVWQKIVRRGIPQAPVFEDDIQATPAYSPKVWQLDIAKFGFDILRLEEACPFDEGQVLRGAGFPGMDLVASGSFGTACYIVTLTGAKKLLQEKKYWFLVDHYNLCDQLHSIKSAALRPSIFVQS